MSSRQKVCRFFFFPLRKSLLLLCFRKDYGETRIFLSELGILVTMRPQVIQPSMYIREESNINFIRAEERYFDDTGKNTVEAPTKDLESLEYKSKGFELTRFYLQHKHQSDMKI